MMIMIMMIIAKRSLSEPPRGKTTHGGVDVKNTHLSMINPDHNMMLAISVTIYQYSAY